MHTLSPKAVLPWVGKELYLHYGTEGCWASLAGLHQLKKYVECFTCSRLKVPAEQSSEIVNLGPGTVQPPDGS